MCERYCPARHNIASVSLARVCVQPADVGKLRKMGGRQRRKERERRLREASGAGKGAGFNQLGGQGLASKPNPGRPGSSDGKGPKKRKR